MKKKSISPFQEAFVNFVLKHSKACVILSIVIACAFIVGVAKMKSSFAPRSWFDANHPDIQTLNAYEKRFGNDQTIVIGVQSKNGIFNNETLNKVRDITAELWGVTDIARVESLSNFNLITGTADGIEVNPLLPEERELSQSDILKIETSAVSDETTSKFFFSQDKKLTIIIAHLKNSIVKDPDFRKIEAESREIIKKYTQEDLQFFLVGDVVANNAFEKLSFSDNMKILPFSTIVMMLILFFLFRSFFAIIFPISMIFIVIGMTYGFLGHIGFIFTSMLSAVPGILFAIGLADSIHILNGFFMKFNEGSSPKEALSYSLNKNFKPTLLTSISTSISFLTITLTDIAPIGHLGYLSAFGSITLWFYSYIFLGAALNLCTNSIEKRVKRRKPVSFPTHFLNKFKNYSTTIILAFIIITLGSLYLASKNEVNSDPIKYFDKSLPIVNSYNLMRDKMNGAKGVELVIDSQKTDGIKASYFLQKVENYANALRADENITRVRSILEVVKKMNQVFNSDKNKFYRIPDDSKKIADILFFYSLGLPEGVDLKNQYSLDGRYLRLSLTWTIESSKEGNQKLTEILKLARQNGLSVSPGGNFPIYNSINDKIVSSFVSSIGMGLILMSLLMLVVFKSFKLALISMFPNFMPLIVGGGLMYLNGTYIDIGSSIVYAVSLGIAVDDTIHFIASFHHYHTSGFSTEKSIEKTLNETGRALITTTILLAVGFGAFVFAEFIPSRNFGIYCTTILVFALICDLFFLPAILLKLNKD